MSHILLLGAGFSRNWGGWLASELIGDLLGRIYPDHGLASLMRRPGNFENALAQVQSDYKTQQSAEAKARLDRLQSAILASFKAMNQAFVHRGSMEFSNFREFSVQRFLSQFDAIFTLNQDLLFELYYDISMEAPQRWNGHSFPGMSPPANWPQGTGPIDRIEALWSPLEEFRVDKNVQPIFKLHGSVNWRSGDGGELLVMGANKQGMILQSPLLREYAEQFRAYLENPGTRLMVIGYSFLDEHINRMIYDAWTRTRQLAIFVIDPLGLGVLNKSPPNQIRIQNPLEEIPSLGESRRPLSSTFNADQLEHGKLMRFFAAPRN